MQITITHNNKTKIFERPLDALSHMEKSADESEKKLIQKALHESLTEHIEQIRTPPKI